MREGDNNIVFMRTFPESRLGAVLAEVDKLMKRGHRLIVFVSGTQVMRREKFAE